MKVCLLISKEIRLILELLHSKNKDFKGATPIFFVQRTSY